MGNFPRNGQADLAKHIEQHLWRNYRLDPTCQKWIPALKIAEQLQKSGLAEGTHAISTFLGQVLFEAGVEKKRKTKRRITMYRGLVQIPLEEKTLKPSRPIDLLRSWALDNDYFPSAALLAHFSGMAEIDERDARNMIAQLRNEGFEMALQGRGDGYIVTVRPDDRVRSEMARLAKELSAEELDDILDIIAEIRRR